MRVAVRTPRQGAWVVAAGDFHLQTGEGFFWPAIVRLQAEALHAFEGATTAVASQFEQAINIAETSGSTLLAAHASKSYLKRFPNSEQAVSLHDRISREFPEPDGVELKLEGGTKFL